MLVHKLNQGLLGEIESSERFTVDKTSYAMYRLKLVFCFEWYVFAGEQMNLQRIQLASQEV